MHERHDTKYAKHVAMWHLKDDSAKPTQTAKAMRRLKMIKQKVAEITDIEVGCSLAKSEGDYDIVLTLTVTDADALGRVLNNPHYRKVLAFMDSISDAYHTVDYDRQTDPCQALRDMICEEPTLVMPNV